MGRTLGSNELSDIISWLTDYGASPEVVYAAVKYAADRNKSSLRYIESVVRGWTEEGLMTTDQINEKLQEMDERYYQYKRVLKALGFTRNATEAEKQMMDTWFDKMGILWTEFWKRVPKQPVFPVLTLIMSIRFWKTG